MQYGISQNTIQHENSLFATVLFRLTIEKHTDGLQLKLNTNTSFIERFLAEQFLAHFAGLLTGMEKNLQIAHSNLELLTEQEMNVILSTFVGTCVPFPQ